MEEDGHSIQSPVHCVSIVQNPEPGSIVEEAGDVDAGDGLEDELLLVAAVAPEGHQLQNVLDEHTHHEYSVDHIQQLVLLLGEVAGIEAAEDQVADKQNDLDYLVAFASAEQIELFPDAVLV